MTTIDGTKIDRQEDGYTGKKAWIVQHPDHGRCAVRAKTMDGAILLAADLWKQRWTMYRFYAYIKMTLTEIRREKRDAGA